MARPNLTAAPAEVAERLADSGWLEAPWQAACRRLEAEWFASSARQFTLARPRAQGFAASPADPRPVDPAVGAALLAGTFTLGGATLTFGPNGDPFDSASPNRRFAIRLHRFDWLADLMTTGAEGARRAVQLTLDWRRAFGGWNDFSWSGEILERRVFNLARAAKAIGETASDAETAILADSLARQARHLLRLRHGPARAAEAATAAALAGAVLAGPAGERLMAKALQRLDRLLPHSVLPDGGHASRSPEAGLDLLLDLLTLDDALAHRGRSPPEELPRAIDRLGAALRFFTLPDKRLACFQGGEAAPAARIAAAQAQEDARTARPLTQLPHTGYHRLGGGALSVIADAGAPARGAWSVTATAQLLAVEILAGRDRLITNCGWSPECAGPQAFRLTGAGSTATLAGASVGEPLEGFRERALGPRLTGAPHDVRVRREDAEAGLLLEMAHDGWAARFGLIHERRLFLDPKADELRGEDRVVPAGRGLSERIAPVAVRFHLHPDVKASLARDGRSVLLRGPSNAGWWLRNDAGQVEIEPSFHFEDGGVRRPTSQVVLRGDVRAGAGGRVRWKLTAAEGA